MPFWVFNCPNVDALVVEIPGGGETAAKADGPECRQPWLPLQRHASETAVRLIGNRRGADSSRPDPAEIEPAQSHRYVCCGW